jgi:hypothetical protein
LVNESVALLYYNDLQKLSPGIKADPINPNLKSYNPNLINLLLKHITLR